MSITATELKMNLSKYLLLAETEDIYITRNGKVVAKLSNPYQNRVDMAKSLFGAIPSDMTLEQSKFVLYDLLDTAAMDCRRALSSNMTDYEDAVMAETALRSGCDCIVTRNLKDYKNASIPSYSSSDFLQHIMPTEE